MTRICPNPIPWDKAYTRLVRFSETHTCTPPKPPVPLILGGWWSSSDIDKMNRWKETIEWATANGCTKLVNGVSDSEFYCVDYPSDACWDSETVCGMHLWDVEPKIRPTSAAIEEAMKALLDQWSEVAGEELSTVTRPIAFTGRKLRRLLVRAEATARPPWGGWTHISYSDSGRPSFKSFRASVNRAIAPHEVDHIDFTTDSMPEHEAQSGVE